MSSSAATPKSKKATDVSKEKEKGKAKSKKAIETLPNRAGWRPVCDICGNDFDVFDPKRGLRCQDCATNIAEWDAADSWVDLLDYNRDFIEGARTMTPYATSPVFTDESLWAGLFMLHDFGILVTDAQREFHKTDFDKEKGQWFEIKERPYLRCVIPANLRSVPVPKVERMLDLLCNNPLLEMVTFYEYTDYLCGKWMRTVGCRCALPVSARKLPLANIPKHQFFRSSVGPSFTGRTVAKHRVADTKEGLIWKTWTKCKHNKLPVVTERDLPPNSQGIRAFGRATKLTSAMLPVIFTVAVREWTEVGLDLADIVCCACEDAGMEPIFAELEAVDDELCASCNSKVNVGSSIAADGAHTLSRSESLPAMVSKLSVEEGE